MVYNTCGRYSMYMYYIVYCQEIAHYNLKNPKKNKKYGGSVINVHIGGSCPMRGGSAVSLARHIVNEN